MSACPHYDVIIVGGGPAGATAARLLAPRFSVLLLESRQITAAPTQPSQEKCCGGLLAPDAQAILARMGLALPPDVREPGQPLAVRAIDLTSGYSRRYPRHYINLNRLKFERWLLSLVPDTVVIRERTRVMEATVGASGWRVITTKGAARFHQYHCTHLVGADGATSTVRRALGAPPRVTARYTAIQDWHACSTVGSTSEYLAFFHPGLTDFYGWLIPKTGHVLLGIALPPAGKRSRTTAELIAAMYAHMAAHGLAFPRQPHNRQACQLLRPGVGDIFLGNGTGYCIGEAAGLISPSSAEGFSYAFSSAIALSESLLGAGSGSILNTYRGRMLTLCGNILLKAAKSAVMYTPVLRGWVMRSGILSERAEKNSANYLLKKH